MACPCKASCDGSHHGPDRREAPLSSSPPALLEQLLWIQAKLKKASRLGQGRLLLPEEKKGRDRTVLGWSRGWVGDVGAVPAATEPDQSQPSLGLGLVPGTQFQGLPWPQQALELSRSHVQPKPFLSRA